MEIKNIDFSEYDENKPETLLTLAHQVNHALSNTGFLSVSNIGIDMELRNSIFQLSKDFFSSSEEVKSEVGYRHAAENFGFQNVGEEHLDPSKPADVKETFTMRDLPKYLDQADRWPSLEFRDQALVFFEACISAAHKLMRVFAVALDTPSDFFILAHKGENITLRFLHYPSIAKECLQSSQLGAGAHTDYGMITLLFQDGVEGLEVQDKFGNWQAAPAYKDRIIINTGDLMNRWTNKLYRSTPHRVKPITQETDRYSIAMFVDPDDDVMIETLQSCISEDRPNVFTKPISAGNHILEKIQATHRQGTYE